MFHPSLQMQPRLKHRRPQQYHAMNTAYAQPADLIDAPDLTTATGSGRATWDERGNSIWEWQTAPGVFTRDVSPQQLQELQASNLHLQDGTEVNHEETLWSRNARTQRVTRRAHATELVMPVRSTREIKSSGFELFLKKMGLPA
jgi:hypothetical protein